LNRSWNSSFTTFDDITLPTGREWIGGVRGTGLARIRVAATAGNVADRRPRIRVARMAREESMRVCTISTASTKPATPASIWRGCRSIRSS
jgi:hypothetical protein